MVHSSLHAQNSVVSEFLRQDPYPKPVSLCDWTKLAIPWATTREELLYHLSHLDVSATGILASTSEERLFQLTVEVSSPAMNSGADMCSHILCIASHLWKAMIIGTGEHDLLCANPASSLPIRFRFFASLVQLISLVSSFMAKHGMSQLNGLSRFNVGSSPHGLTKAEYLDPSRKSDSTSKAYFIWSHQRDPMTLILLLWTPKSNMLAPTLQRKGGIDTFARLTIFLMTSRQDRVPLVLHRKM